MKGYIEDLGWYTDRKFAVFGNTKGRIVKCVTGNKWESLLNLYNKGKEVKYTGEINCKGNGVEVRDTSDLRKSNGKIIISKTGKIDENRYLM